MMSYRDTIWNIQKLLVKRVKSEGKKGLDLVLYLFMSTSHVQAHFPEKMSQLSLKAAVITNGTDNNLLNFANYFVFLSLHLAASQKHHHWHKHFPKTLLINTDHLLRNVLAEINHLMLYCPSCFTLTSADSTSGSETFISPNLCTLNAAIFMSDHRSTNRYIQN